MNGSELVYERRGQRYQGRNALGDSYEPWGISATIDLSVCQPARLRSGKLLQEFVSRLIRVIEMEPHGPCHIDRFGDGNLAGWSAMQFITTSTITVHLDEVGNRAFVDIFSCKPFDGNVAADFARKYFGAATARVTQQYR